MPSRGGAGGVPGLPSPHHLAAAGAAILCTQSQGNPLVVQGLLPAFLPEASPVLSRAAGAHEGDDE